MSLIYTALNALDADANVQAPPAGGVTPAVAVVAQRSPMRWLLAIVIACAAIVVIGIVALVMLRGRYTAPPVSAAARMPLTPKPEMAVLPGTGVVATTPTPPVIVLPAPPLASLPATIDASTLPVTAAEQRAGAAAPMAPAVAIVARPAAVPSPQAGDAVAATPDAIAATEGMRAPAKSVIAVEHILPPGAAARVVPAGGRKVMRAPADRAATTNAQAPDAQPRANVTTEPDADEANRLATGVRQAIDAGRMDDAAAQLRQMATRMPAESITLMRLQGWYALRAGDSPHAQLIYRQIVDRLPDDEPAAVNLAVLYWRAGQHAEARRVIAALAERRPDSESVRHYTAEFAQRP